MRLRKRDGTATLSAHDKVPPAQELGDNARMLT